MANSQKKLSFTRGIVPFAAIAAVSASACAARTDSKSEESELARFSETPITNDNFRTHPKLEAIRAEVAAVEGASLTLSMKGPTQQTCGAILSKGTDGASHVRKFAAVRKGSSTQTTTYYYDSLGLMQMVSRLDATPPSGVGDGLVAETHAYRYFMKLPGPPTRIVERWFELSRSARWSQTNPHTPPDVSTLPFGPITGPLSPLSGCVVPGFVDRQVVADPGSVFDGGCVAPDAPVSALALAACGTP